MFDTSEVAPTHLVVYTDGGCWQDLRIGGWGLHGYFYIEEPAKTGTGCKKAMPTPTGYESKATGKPDITVTHYVDAFKSLPSDATNNIAELSAGLKALELALESGVANALILTDSKYFLKGLTEWLPGWKRSNWILSTGKPVVNKELWVAVDEAYSKIQEKKINLQMKWVKGHSGEFGNEIVDKLASLSMRAAINGRPVDECNLAQAKGYWKQSKTHSRLLNMPAWYFGVRDNITSTTEDGRTIYYQGELRDSEDFNGKMISDASFSVVYLREPDPVMEIIRAESLKLAKASFYGLAVGYMPAILKPDNYELIETYGVKFLTYDMSKNRLQNFRKEVLVEERRPVRRAYYAVDRLTHLEEILKDYLGNRVQNYYCYTDITDLLYETVAGKKTSSVKLRSHIVQSTKYLDIEVGHTVSAGGEGKAKIRMVLTQDIPDRNTLSAIAEEGIKVVVVTWADSESVIRFATIVQTNNDVGIWSGVYSNLAFVPTPSR